MFARIRSLWLAGGGALALTIVLSGVVAAATVLTALTVSPPTTTTVADTTATFEDTNGNGIHDDCETDVVADPVAAASAQAAVDADGNGTVSVPEAAHSDRTGGTNCNHGGYVSQVAQGSCGATEPAGTTDEDSTEESTDGSVGADEAAEADEDADTNEVEADEPADCTTDETTDAAKPEAPTCDAAPTTTENGDGTTDESTDQAAPAEDPAPNAHGKAVAAVAHSDAVGGKNCNHGGAVSEAAKKDHAADKEARDAAKAAREAERAAAKAARDAARHQKHHGKPG
jgi:hypothetical protein